VDGESPVAKSSAADSIQAWIASFLLYLELRLQLLGLEARQAGLHLLMISLLLVSMLVCFAGCLLLLIVFLLYLMMLILHWAWGWCALALAAVLFSPASLSVSSSGSDLPRLFSRSLSQSFKRIVNG
jgi:hypothetical protein